VIEITILGALLDEHVNGTVAVDHGELVDHANESSLRFLHEIRQVDLGTEGHEVA